MEAGMVSLRIRYLVEDIDRHGNVRLYVRRPGRPKVRIKATPGTKAFTEAYEAALNKQPKRGAKQGSFRSACEGYYASPTFEKLDASTRKWRRRELDKICLKDGDKPIALMLPKHIKRLREAVPTPGAANNRLKALKALFGWAMEEELIDRNPAREVKKISYATNGHHPWTLEEVEQFEARHPIGTKARLAMALMFYTAGRREDAVRLGPKNIRSGRVRFTQAKNEHRKPVTIDVPLHPDLEAVIAGTPIVGAKTYLVTEFGKPFEPAGFGNWFADRCDEAGVPGRAHGLRKALATRLADSGATAHEIMAWTGHMTLEEVEVYTREAQKKRNADAGLRKMRADEK